MSTVLFTSPLLLDAVDVESSSLAKVAYHYQRAILHYLSVPRQTYRDLLQADSKGTYFNHQIRNQFPHAIVRPRWSALAAK